MQIDEAVRQIGEIRAQMVRGEVFRGYRAATVALSGTAGLAVAAIQDRWVPAPASDPDRYLLLWGGVAAVSLIVAGAEVFWRAKQSGSGLTRRHTLIAVEQFLPTVLVGALLTACIRHTAPESVWMLPGLWAMVFGLGIFASSRLLPREAWLVGCYYILCGCGCLMWGRGPNTLSPWLMGTTFGGGQLLGAAVLFWTLERFDAATQGE